MLVGKNDAFRSVDLNDDRVIETNMLFACRYMIAGWTGLFDLSARIAYAANELVGMMAYEVLIWCNMFCRMLHIDFIHLFTGVDTLSLRKYIDGDLDTDNTGPFFAFLDDHRGPFGVKYKGQPQWANASVIYPNSWLANKWKRLFTEIGSGFQQVKWCYRPERGTPQYPYRNVYIHATAQILCFGQITRYHQAKDLVGATFWFLHGFQIVLRGDTIILQAKSVMDRIPQVTQTDPLLLDKFQNHLC